MKQSVTFTVDANVDVDDLTPGRNVILAAEGAFGSGTLTLYWGHNDTYVAFASGTLTANGILNNMRLPSDQLRIGLSGSTSPALNVVITYCKD